MCVFLQEPLKNHEDVAFYAEKIFDVDLDGDHIATMGYKQRKKANEGIEEINAIDDAMYVGLKASCQPKRMVGKLGKILCILTTLVSSTAEAEKVAESRKTVLYFADQFPGEQRNNYESKNMTWHDSRGNLSFLTNMDPPSAELVKSWTDTDRYTAPKCIYDIDTPEFYKFIEQIKKDKLTKTA